MYCRQCGKPIPEGGTFCMMCGAKVNEASEPLSSVEDSPSNQAASPRKHSRSKLKTILIVSLPIITAALIAFVLLFVFGFFPLNSEPARIISCNISVQDGVLNFDVTADGESYDNISFEYDEDSYDEIYSEDFMKQPTDLAVLLKDDDGEIEVSFNLENFMVIDTSEDDSIKWKDYSDAITLFVYDPNDEVKIDDINELSSLKSLYLLGLSDTENLSDLSLNTKLISLSLNSMNINDFGKIENLTSLQELKLINLDIDSIDGIDNFEDLSSLEISRCPITDADDLNDLEKLVFLKLDYLKKLNSIDVLEDIENLKVLILNKMFKIPLEEAEDIVDYLEDEDVIVKSELLPAYVSSIERNDVTVGFINVNTDEYYSYFENTFKTLAELEGIEVIVRYSDDSITKEMSNVKELVELGVDAIAIISVENEDSVQVIDFASEAGVPVFCLAHPIYTEDDDPESKGDVKEFSSITAYTLGRWVAENYPNSSCVTLAEEYEASGSFDLIVGFNQGLVDGGAEKSELLDFINPEGDNVKDCINSLIYSNTDFDVIFVCKEKYYEDAVNTLIERGITEKIIVSTNGRDEYWSELENGNLTATSPNPPSLTADLCLQQIIGYLNDDDYDSYIHVYPKQVLTKDNLDSAIPWDADRYIEARLKGSFEFGYELYSQQNLDDYNLMVDMLDVIVEYIKSL